MNRRRSIAVALGMVALIVAATNQFGWRGGDVVLTVEPVAPLRVAAGTPLAPTVAVATREVAEAPVAPQPASLPEPPVEVAQAVVDPCAMALEVFAEEGAMIGLTLRAPCRPDARVVLGHAGLAVSLRTLATGTLIASLPALDAAGAISLRFDDGAELTAAVPMPEVAGLRRFAVQWQGGDRFALRADAGDTVALGDASAAPALLAEVHTFPDPASSHLSIEAEVTGDTCGRELLGETLYATGGAVRADDLTLAMPDCDGIAGFVVLNNPLPDMTLAIAE